MEPRFIIQDVGGKHNEDLDKTAARLMKGSSWKKTRVILILPAGDSLPAVVALSHWNLIFPPNQGVLRILAQGMEVGEAYSGAIGQILSNPDLSQWEYILTIEHDNMPPADGLLKLIKRMEEHPEFSAIGGLYFTKGEEGVAQIWGDPRDVEINYRPQVPISGALVECCGTGMGFTLFRLSMFKDEKLRKPWFKTLSGIAGTGVGTQDLYFWGDARRHGYRCAVDCDVRVGHYEAGRDIVW